MNTYQKNSAKVEIYELELRTRINELREIIDLSYDEWCDMYLSPYEQETYSENAKTLIHEYMQEFAKRIRPQLMETLFKATSIK